jgi:hypothetical protein
MSKVIRNPMLDMDMPVEEDEPGDVQLPEAAKGVAHKRYTGGGSLHREGGGDEQAERARRKRLRKANKFSDREWLQVFLGCVLPIIDSWSDWAVTLEWYQQDEKWWYGIGTTILMFSGIVSGVAFWRLTMAERFQHWKPPELAQNFWGDLCLAFKHYAAKMYTLLIGFVGLVPAGQAYLVLKYDDEGNVTKRDHSKQKIAFL